MPDFVYDLPAQVLMLRFVLVALGAMLLGLLVCKPVLRLMLGTGEDFNNSLHQTTSSFTLFYGLVLGLLTVSAYQNHEKVQHSVFYEVSRLSSLYGAMDTYPEPLRSDVRTALLDYTRFTIDRDWPAHARADFLPGGAAAMQGVRQQLAGFEPRTGGESILHAQTFQLFQQLIEARLDRISGILLGIPDLLWTAVLLGAGINILLIALLRMRPLQQFVLGSISAVFLGIILSVIVTLDAPLRGTTAVKPAAFEIFLERTLALNAAGS